MLLGYTSHDAVNYLGNMALSCSFPQSSHCLHPQSHFLHETSEVVTASNECIVLASLMDALLLVISSSSPYLPSLPRQAHMSIRSFVP